LKLTFDDPLSDYASSATCGAIVRISGLMSAGGAGGLGFGGAIALGQGGSPGERKAEEARPPGYWDSSSSSDDDE